MPPGVHDQKRIFCVLNQNICCGYSKEPSQWDGSFEHLKLMFKMKDKKYSHTILRIFFLLIWTQAVIYFSTSQYCLALHGNKEKLKNNSSHK